MKLISILLSLSFSSMALSCSVFPLKLECRTENTADAGYEVSLKRIDSKKVLTRIYSLGFAGRNMITEESLKYNKLTLKNRKNLINFSKDFKKAVIVKTNGDKVTEFQDLSCN